MAETDADAIEPERESADLSDSPGEILAQARERKGLTRIRVAELLGLTQSSVRDIELCRFEKFPSGIYTRGYLRNYCKLVDADEATVLAAYDRYSQTHEVPEDAPFGSSMPQMPENRKIGKMVAIGLALVLIALAIWWIFG